MSASNYLFLTRNDIKSGLKWVSLFNKYDIKGVIESLADFIQGRAAATVGSAHYLNKVQQAKDEYRRIMGKFCF